VAFELRVDLLKVIRVPFTSAYGKRTS
jgi:hypothetical protein